MDSNILYINLKKLYEYELYANVIPIANILLSVQDRDHSFLTLEQHFLTYIYFGNSLYYEREYRKAEKNLRQALQIFKSIKQKKLKTSLSEQFPELEITYKLAICLERTKQISQSLTLIDSIPLKKRTPKINMLFGRLLRYIGQHRTAIGPLREVLRECPLNLEAIIALLKVGISCKEICSIVWEVASSPYCHDWLESWINAHSLIFSSNFDDAINLLQTIESSSFMGNDELILILIGKCHYYNGDYDAAIHYLMKVHNRNFYLSDGGLMTLAAIFARNNKIEELERLTMVPLTQSEYTSENWCVLAYQSFVQERYEKAAYFAQKACCLNPKNTEAILLKVKIFIELKKYKEALTHLRIVQEFAPYRYEIYEAFVNIYLLTKRFSEAHNYGIQAIRIIGKTPRAYMLMASTYVNVGDKTKKKAIVLLNRALEANEYYLPAVYLLADIYQKNGEISKACNLIKKQVKFKPNSKLYALLGELYLLQKKQAKAIENFTHAINLDPNNRKAVAGLIQTGQSAVLNEYGKNEEDYLSTIQETNEQDMTDYTEAAYEAVGVRSSRTGVGENESETDIIWSDVDVEIEVNTLEQSQN